MVSLSDNIQRGAITFTRLVRAGTLVHSPRPKENTERMDPQLAMVAQFNKVTGTDPPKDAKDLSQGQKYRLECDKALYPVQSAACDEPLGTFKNQCSGVTLEYKHYKTTRLPLSDDPTSALLWFHQGGMVIGNCRMSSYFLQTIADRCNIQVFSLEYRMAPEHLFPTAFDDAVALWDYVQTTPSSLNVDPSRVLIGGDSAGGMITTHLTQTIRDRGGVQPIFHLAVYPWLFGGEEVKEEDCHFPLSVEMMDYFSDALFVDEKQKNSPLANPGRGNLKHVPTGMVVTAGFCGLRYQGYRYVENLKADGILVDHVHYPTMTHSFLDFVNASNHAKASVEEMVAKIHTHLLHTGPRSLPRRAASDESAWTNYHTAVGEDFKSSEALAEKEVIDMLKKSDATKQNKKKDMLKKSDATKQNKKKKGTAASTNKSRADKKGSLATAEKKKKSNQSKQDDLNKIESEQGRRKSFVSLVNAKTAKKSIDVPGKVGKVKKSKKSINGLEREKKKRKEKKTPVEMRIMRSTSINQSTH